MWIRPMRASDVTFLSELWVASWSETMPEIDFGGRRAWLANVLHDPAHEMWVAETAGTPVGFVTIEAAHLHVWPSHLAHGMAA